jgi:hypothetical protein
MFRNRSVVEIIVLTFTLVVGASLLGLGGIIAIIEIRDPATDTSAAVQSLVSVLSGIIGALLGLLAGKAERLSSLTSRPEEREREGL